MTAAPGARAVLLREVRRLGREPVAPGLLLASPLLAFGLLWAVFASAVPRDLPLAFVDQDGSAASRAVARAVDATPGLRLAWRVPDEGAARDLVLSGHAYGFVVAPEGLGRGLRRGQAPPVVALYNASLLLPASLVRRDLRSAVGTLSAGLEVRQRAARGDGRLAPARFEPVRTDRHTLFNPALSYADFLLPALLPTVLQVFVLLSGVQALGSELRQGTAADWLATAGGRLSRAVAGKLAPYAAAHFVLAGAALSLLFRGLGVPLRGSTLAVVLGAVLLVLACLGLAVLLVAWTASLRFATSVAAFVAGPAFAFAGVTFPTASMPPLARAWSVLLPLTHFLRVLVDQGQRGAGLPVSASSLAALGLLAVLPPLLAWRRLGRACRDPLCWGRP